MTPNQKPGCLLIIQPLPMCRDTEISILSFLIWPWTPVKCYLVPWLSPPKSHLPRKGTISPHGPQYHLGKSSCNPSLWTLFLWVTQVSFQGQHIQACRLLVSTGHQTPGSAVACPVGQPHVLYLWWAFLWVGKTCRLLFYIFTCLLGFWCPTYQSCSDHERSGSSFQIHCAPTLFLNARKINYKRKNKSKWRANTNLNFKNYCVINVSKHSLPSQAGEQPLEAGHLPTDRSL